MRLLEDALRRLRLAVDEAIEAARRDDKTPLGNVIALNEAGSHIGRDLQSPDVLVFGDLNRFKQINDEHGHSAGDAVIKQAGTLLHTMFVEGLRAQGFRKSGDEFVLLLKKDKLPIFKAQVKGFGGAVTFEEKAIPFSMSFGYACSDDNEGVDFQKLLERAEVACQKAKADGDGVCIGWTSELSEQELLSVRRRCHHCNTTTSCFIPKERIPDGGKLTCPVCQEELHPSKSTS